MLKGTRDGLLKRVQPVSIHGQISWDVFFTDPEDPDGQTHVARIGPEAVHGHLEPGMEVMTKPFLSEAFARRIKQLIGRGHKADED